MSCVTSTVGGYSADDFAAQQAWSAQQLASALQPLPSELQQSAPALQQSEAQQLEPDMQQLESALHVAPSLQQLAACVPLVVVALQHEAAAFVWLDFGVVTCESAMA